MLGDGGDRMSEWDRLSCGCPGFFFGAMAEKTDEHCGGVS